MGRAADRRADPGARPHGGAHRPRDLDARPNRGKLAPEFVPLAAALTDMAIKLAERDRELRAANRHLEALASIDGLSGLANRRSFDARLQTEWQRAAELKRRSP